MEIVVTHLTRMAAGYICVAGIDDRGRHVRPVLDGKRLGSHLLSQNGGPFALCARIDLGPTIPVGSTPEVEDLQFEPENLRLVGIEPPHEVWRLAQGIAELRLRDIFGEDLTPSRRGAHVPPGRGRCSLGVLEPAYRPRLLIEDGKPRCRLTDPTFDELNLSVTDLQFYREREDGWEVDEEEVARVQAELASGRQPLLAVGLTRPWPNDRPAHWLQINGIQLEPHGHRTAAMTPFHSVVAEEPREDVTPIADNAAERGGSRVSSAREIGDGGSSHPELVAEQRYFDHALAHRERRRRRTQETLQNPMGVHAGAAKALREAAKARLEAMGGPDQPVAHGRIDLEDGDTYYIGRYPILDENYDELVISWKTDLAVPFYQASPSNRMGLALKRVFETEQNRIRDIFDEDYLDPLRGHSVSRDAVLRELERGRSGRLTDIIRTIEAAQDRVMRHPADGALIVQGGPGTGKTVVGLQRTSLLIYRENLEAERLLFVGPSHGFMKYVSQVLPSLGDEAVRQLAIADLSPIRVGELQKEDDSIAEIKGRAAMLEVLRMAIRDRRNLPVDDTRVVINDQVIVLSRDEVASIVSAHLETERPHNLVRPTIRNEIGRLVNRKLRAPDPSGRRDPAELPASDRIPSSREIDNLLDRMWPTFSPQEFLRDLLASEQRLLAASRGLLDETAARSVARPPQARLVDEPWTLSDMALLDSLQELLNGRSEIPSYAHIVVDEAQDLSPMQLLSLRRRAEGGITLLGDLAQATGAWGHDSWEPVIDVLDYPSTDVVELEVGYRVPAEVMEIAGRLVADLDLPVRVPESIRPVGEPVEFLDASTGGLERTAIEATRAYLNQGRSVALISSEGEVDRLRFALDYEGIDAADGREEMSSTVVVVPARYSKGLEFDAVVVVEPAEIVANAAQGVRELFVAFTRTVRNLSIVYKQPLPAGLEEPGAEPRDGATKDTPGPEATSTEIPEREPASTYSIPEVREEHPNAYAPWEKQDEELLVFLLVQGRTVDEIGRMLGRQRGGISSRLRKLGLVD